MEAKNVIPEPESFDLYAIINAYSRDLIWIIIILFVIIFAFLIRMYYGYRAIKSSQHILGIDTVNNPDHTYEYLWILTVIGSIIYFYPFTPSLWMATMKYYLGYILVVIYPLLIYYEAFVLQKLEKHVSDTYEIDNQSYLVKEPREKLFRPIENSLLYS